MSSGVQPEFLDAQVDRVFTELEGRFNVAGATDLGVVALVFGPALERRAQESHKRSRSAEMSDLARRIAVLAQSRDEEPTPKAKKTAGLNGDAATSLAAFSLDDVDYPVFHSPYGKMVQKAHARLVRLPSVDASIT